MGEKTRNDKAYERGVKDGKSGNPLTDVAHGFGTVLNTGKEDETYDKGYEWGAKHRHDSDKGKDSSTGSSGSNSSKSSGCYLTTACAASMELPDNCFELTMLRRFRDKILIPTSKGRKAVEEYYTVAPEVVHAVNQEDDPTAIWRSVCKDIRYAISLIMKGDYDGAFRHYQEMTAGLKNRYLS